MGLCFVSGNSQRFQLLGICECNLHAYGQTLVSASTFNFGNQGMWTHPTPTHYNGGVALEGGPFGVGWDAPPLHPK